MYGAVDMLSEADRESERLKQQNKDKAAQQSGPRFSGGIG